VGRAGWYRYYAGFSPAFVRDALHLVAPPRGARILDPWNGGGTTTEVASSMGLEALGFDLNPTMVIVAKARLLNSEIAPSLGSILGDLLYKAMRLDAGYPCDPLSDWFTPRSAAALRRFERALRMLLVSPNACDPLFEQATFAHVSSLAAFFYVSAFRVVRELLSPFRSANPTWLKQPTVSERVSVTERQLHEKLQTHVRDMAGDLAVLSSRADWGHATIERASSLRLPLGDGSVDAVLSSPPYCTRIDYVNGTGPELALLGAKPGSLRALRDQMIGTPTISQVAPRPESHWGGSCLAAIEGIGRHGSRASKSYYLKTYVQYFDGLNTSIREIGRVLKPGGKCLLVVQDSYYKELHVNLATIVDEMVHPLGWYKIGRADFPTVRTMAGVNTRARENGNPTRATETVLVFRKGR
jgi:DNA modification methylase